MGYDIPADHHSSPSKPETPIQEIHAVEKKAYITNGLQLLIELCHNASYARGWWHDQATGRPLIIEGSPQTPYIKCTKLLLTVSEIGECMEGLRTDAPDDKLPQFSMETVEIADAMIRLCDYAGAYGLPVVAAILAKMDFNAVRKDHDVETRKAKGGKKF